MEEAHAFVDESLKKIREFNKHQITNTNSVGYNIMIQTYKVMKLYTKINICFYKWIEISPK